MYPKILEAQSPDIASRIYSTSQVHYVLPLCLYLSYATLYANESQIAKLQRIQNSAARLVTLSCKYDHITPILHELHWLPVKYRIIYKILLLTYKCLHGMGPIYLQELLKEYKPVRQLRLITSITSTQYGQRSFSAAASELWNDLPLHVKNSQTLAQFKSSVKTQLFTLAF